MPDVLTPRPEYSLFTMGLYARSYIEDFAMEYLRGGGFAPVDPDTFALSDEAWAAFVAYMADKSVDYRSPTRDALDELVRQADREDYGAAIAPPVEAIRAAITRDKNDELARLRGEIAPLIEDAIVLYDHYAAGVVRHNLIGDPTLAAAAGVLADGAEYRRILTTQDTRRNEPQE